MLVQKGYYLLDHFGHSQEDPGRWEVELLYYVYLEVPRFPKKVAGLSGFPTMFWGAQSLVHLEFLSINCSLYLTLIQGTIGCTPNVRVPMVFIVFFRDSLGL